MGHVWYVRHGESESNVRGVFAGGQDNTPLTDVGREQAKLAGQVLKNFNINFDHIISSPLDRTKETAKIIANELQFTEDNIEYDERLQEYDVGTGNGTPYEGATSEQLVGFPGAEKPEAFKKRVHGVLAEIKAREGNTLIVAHGGVGRLISCLEADGDPADFYSYPKYPNAQPKKLNLDWLQ